MTENNSALVTGALTALFVPGNRPERFAKACSSGADLVIIDLEDAVGIDDKKSARTSVVEALTGPCASYGNGDGVRAVVRLNAPGTVEYEEDLEALLEVADLPGNGLVGLMLPKAENPVQLAGLSSRLPESVALVALVESALGVVNSVELARVPGVDRLAFGAIDYALDIDAGEEDRFLDTARAQLVLASRAARIAAPLDSPVTEIRRQEAIAASAAIGRGFGFGGKLCIHPGQLNAVAGAYRPTAAQMEWATRVLTAEGDAAQVDGKMVDRPVTERARRILARNTATPHSSERTE